MPQLERFSESRIDLIIIGPDLPLSSDVPQDFIDSIRVGEGAVLVRSPEDQTTCNHVLDEPMASVVDDQEGRCLYYEPFSNSSSYLILNGALHNLTGGEYRLAFFNRKNTTTKFWSV